MCGWVIMCGGGHHVWMWSSCMDEIIMCGCGPRVWMWTSCVEGSSCEDVVIMLEVDIICGCGHHVWM